MTGSIKVEQDVEQVTVVDASETKPHQSPEKPAETTPAQESHEEPRDDADSSTKDKLGMADSRDSNCSSSASRSIVVSARDQAPPKRSHKHKKASVSNRNAGRFPPDRYYPGRGPYNGHGMHHGGHMGPPPPHYGYGGPPPDYRGPPLPHYHQMPPMPPQGGPYGPGPNGHYGPPPGMGGRHPGSGYGVPYGAPYPHMGGGMPPYHPSMSYQGPGGVTGVNENSSISSNKSKSSAKSKSQFSKNEDRKKRTIDGVMDSVPHHMHHNQDMTNSAYSFRRTTSTASSSTTVTAGNNTSMDTTDTDNSKQRDHAHSELPPLPHPSHNSFDESGGRRGHHRRDPSGASTTSSLSASGFSLNSLDRVHEENHMTKQSPKRRKGEDNKVLIVDTGNTGRHARAPSNSSHSIGAAETSRFEKLTMEDRDAHPENGGASLFLSLSTSPINHTPDVDATPISKNTKKPTKSAIKASSGPAQQPSAFMAPHLMSASRSNQTGDSKITNRTADTPTPPLASSTGTAENDMMTDEHSMLNKHLRIQSFTPVHHMGAQGENGMAADSPSNMAFGSIAPQLSWSIAGDTPSLGDLAEWEEHTKGDDKKRPSSTTSSSSRKMGFSPHSFNLWAEDDNGLRSVPSGESAHSMRILAMTPHSELNGMMEGTLSGTTTPLPIFFDHPSSEERENRTDLSRSTYKKGSKNGDPEHIHSLFVSNAGRSSEKAQKGHMHHHFWSKGEPTPAGTSDNSHHMGLPPTPMFGVEYGRDDCFGSPRHRDDFFPAGAMYGHPGSHERVRNLRGRVHHGHHMAPMPLHIPPPMSSHLPMTSPMGVGKAGGMWSPHHGGMPPMGSPMHMSPMNMSQSKRKCVPLKPPIPSKFQGDIEKVKTAQVPEFTSLVNFPAHMSQKQAVNLPDGMRCCVMCGSACPCSSGNKNKKGAKGANSSDGSLAPRNSNGQDMLGEKGGYAIIPTQNKGLCTLCDVNVWVVVTTGLEIKWCKGCKNFRPWAAFGDKGLATKCLRCRERQREKYALQKEEKEKARLVAKAGSKK